MAKIKPWMCLIGFLLVAQTQVFSQKKIFIAFDVQLSGQNTVTIHWTRPEEDSFDYVLEKSGDTKMWDVIANISSQISPCYDYIDLQSEKSVNYYRVAQRRNEQRLAVSDTKWIQTATTNKLYTWPSPAKDILHVRSPFVNGNMDIIDAEGQLIGKIAITNFITDVSVQALSNGMYFIHVRHGQDILVAKFIKQQSF